jgi:hypothetical protein
MPAIPDETSSVIVAFTGIDNVRHGAARSDSPALATVVRSLDV